jgi:hypothetical protein
VRVIPYDKRSTETVAFVGSLVGATEEIDMATLNQADYVRVRIVARDVCNVPEIVEGAILPYLYDFHSEREVEMGNAPIVIPITIPEKKREDQPTPKNAKTTRQSSSQQLHVSVNRGGANAGQGGNSSEMKKMKEVVRSFSKMFAWSSSASTKLVG